MALGDEVAEQIVALRANDGSGEGLAVHATRGARVLATRPAHGGQPLLVLGRGDTLDDGQCRQFSPEPPPSIFAHEFAQDLAELKAIGGTTSSVRTLEQECIARFTTDNPVAQYHRLARIVAEAVPSDLEHNARAFAVFSLALADAFISSFEGSSTIISGARGRQSRTRRPSALRSCRTRPGCR